MSSFETAVRGGADATFAPSAIHFLRTATSSGVGRGFSPGGGMVSSSIRLKRRLPAGSPGTTFLRATSLPRSAT